jgi:hypothetical protein
MACTSSNWENDLQSWLKPFLDHLGHKARRRMCPLYVAGLIGPGDRKSVAPMAERFAPSDYGQYHHFVAAGVWAELLVQADKLVGGSDAVLVIDDTPMPKKGGERVVAHYGLLSGLVKTPEGRGALGSTLFIHPDYRARLVGGAHRRSTPVLLHRTTYAPCVSV